MTNAKKSLLLILISVALVVLPLVINQHTDFSGTDGQAEEAITQIDPDYQPWFKSIWQPPGAEVESLLFALQAALGAGFLGYFIGYKRGQAKGREK